MLQTILQARKVRTQEIKQLRQNIIDITIIEPIPNPMLNAPTFMLVYTRANVYSWLVTEGPKVKSSLSYLEAKNGFAF